MIRVLGVVVACALLGWLARVLTGDKTATYIVALVAIVVALIPLVRRGGAGNGSTGGDDVNVGALVTRKSGVVRGRRGGSGSGRVKVRALWTSGGGKVEGVDARDRAHDGDSADDDVRGGR